MYIVIEIQRSRGIEKKKKNRLSDDERGDVENMIKIGISIQLIYHRSRDFQRLTSLSMFVLHFCIAKYEVSNFAFLGASHLCCISAMLGGGLVFISTLASLSVSCRDLSSPSCRREVFNSLCYMLKRKIVRRKALMG